MGAGNQPVVSNLIADHVWFGAAAGAVELRVESVKGPVRFIERNMTGFMEIFILTNLSRTA